MIRNPRRKGMLIVLFMSAVFGILTFAMLYVYRMQSHKFSTCVGTEAIILDVESHRDRVSEYHNAVVRYNFNGREYVENLGYYYSGMYIGQRISILVDPDAPWIILSSGSLTVLRIVIIVSSTAFISLLTCFILFFMRRPADKQKCLM